MIACLALEPYAPKSLRERLSARVFGPVVRGKTARALGVAYLLLEVSRCRDPSAAWGRIEAALPPDIDCLLCPAGMEPPERYAPPGLGEFEQVLLLETARALVARSGLPACRRVLGLFDPDGAYCGLLPVLLQSFTSVQVRTSTPSRYRPVCERILEEMGAPVLVSENASFGDCALLLCLGDGTLLSPPRCPVLSLRPIPGRMVFCEPRVAGSGSLPPGIDSHTFAGAVFSRSSPSSARPVAASVLLGERRVSLEQAQVILAREAPGVPIL